MQQISLLWYRAARDPGRKRIFCLVSGEKLSYQVCVKAFELMDEILKEITGSYIHSSYSMYMHVYKCINICMHVCMYVCVYLCMYVYILICNVFSRLSIGNSLR